MTETDEHLVLRLRKRVSTGSHSRGEAVTVYVLDINQPSLPTPFCSVLVSIYVFMALSTVFHLINSPDNSPLSHSVLPVLFRPYWSFPCQDPAGNRTTRRPDHRKETKPAVVWTCLPSIRSGQNHLARHFERGKKTRQTEELGRQN